LDLKGKVALVTGALRGIGRAIAIALAKEGAKVAINYNRSEDAAKEVMNIIIKNGGIAKIYKADVSKRLEVEAMVENIIKDFGTIHILVNNAGIISKTNSILELEDDEWDNLININLKGAYLCCKTVLPHMIKNNWGKVITISSVAGKMGGNVGPHYSASKSGLIGFTFALARELAKYNITANVVAPGPIETDMIHNIPKDLQEIIKSKMPLGRFGRPEEVADAVIFLLKNDFITGEVLDVNGGEYFD